MTRAWTRSAAAMLSALALVVVPSVAFSATASAAPIGGADIATTRHSESASGVQLSIDSVAPSAVTANSDPFVTVTATATNVGDGPVEDVSVRMQRAPAVATAPELRTSLRLDQESFGVAGKFVSIADRIEVGQHKQFTLSLPLRSQTAASLNIDKPGIYPLLLNVNGTQQYGSTARLDDARFLLPVLGLPPDNSGSDPESPDSKAVVAPTNTPVALTMLWPLADRPRMAPGQPGSLDEKAKLVDDDLATSLAKGGRLEGLVSALEFAIRSNVDRDHKTADSTCLAVDPDLLVTVDNMTRGYVVLDNPRDPTGQTRPGTGVQAASDWLDRVRALAGKVCTVAVPYAQTDLNAVDAVANSDLTHSAVTSPSDIVDRLLGTKSKRNITWPDAGTIDDDTGKMLRKEGTGAALLAGNAVDTEEGDQTATPELVRLPNVTSTQSSSPETDPALHVAPFDVSVAASMAALGSAPQTPSFTPSRARYDLGQDSGPARLQDALGAMSWSSVNPVPDRPRSLLVAPPQQWGAGADDATGVLSQVSTLLRSGLAVPRSLDDLLLRPPDPRPYQLNYPQQAVDDAVPDAIRNTAADEAGRIDTLVPALVNDPHSELTPDSFVAPLRQDLLRALSMSGRRGDTQENATALAVERLTRSSVALGGLFKAVTVLAPGGVYTLASEESPLLLVARNDLPIGINVKLHIDAPSEMKITDIGQQQLPPRGSRALQVPAQVNASRNLQVDVSLTTPNGRELGDPTKVSVRSNAYGQALAIITACAGALLLVLAGRRLWHRFRGQPDPADEGFERT